jgi:hypothetical protein
MSTKTTFKRIALATVAALGFGVLSSVAPANAVVSSTYIMDTTTIGGTAVSTATGGNATAGLVTGSIVAATAPTSTAIVFKLATVDTATTNDLIQLIVNNQIISGQAAAATNTQNVTSWTTPATAGTYNVIIRTITREATTLTVNNTMDALLTLTVSASAGKTELGNAVTTTASTNAAGFPGVLIPSVGATITETSGRVGQMVGFNPFFQIKRNAGHVGASNDLVGSKGTLMYSVANPAGTAVSVVTAKVAGVASTTQAIVPASATLTTDATTSITTTTSTKGSVVYFAAATAGTYTITVWHDADANGLISAGEATATQSVVVAADALPSITFTKYGSNTTAAQSADGLWGQLVKVSLRNGTTPWQLATNESLVLTSAAATTNFLAYTTWSKGVATWTDASAALAALTLTSANFNGNGDAWFNIGDTSAAGGTFSVSSVISGGTANGTSGSFTITTFNTDAATATDLTDYTLVGNAAVDFANANADLGVDGAAIATGDTTATWNVKLGVATTVSAKVVAGATNYALYNGLVTDTLGLLTGVVGAKYNVNATTPTTGATAATTVSLSVAIPATTAALPTGTPVATMVIDKANNATLTIAATSAVVTSVATDPADLVGNYSIRAANASTNKFTGYVFDQFGNAVVGAACTAAVSGRNATLVSTSLVSDANGTVSFSVADTYTGTLVNTDTLTFTCGVNKTATVTVNYSAYNAPSTIAITGGASADVAPTVTLSQISTAVAGASGATVKMTATVKDANGATLPAGIPVKWAISGLTGTSAILVDATTGYDWSTSMTNSNGEAITYVYAWANGTVSVTATAGAVTSATAGKINFINAAADARVVSATASATGVITAKVVDRYGNGVKGVSITATRTAGTGYFGGNAASSTSGETNADGKVDFIVVGGEATVTVATTTLNAGQTSSAAGFVGATAVTATGIGASLAPVGVQSVSVTVAGNTATQDAATAAADAAAEATDAANAATDAANAAAEAADAATAAAQDAADAVAALSTQVSEMVDALKKQITALTNLVIKIQKKVRA